MNEKKKNAFDSFKADKKNATTISNKQSSGTVRKAETKRKIPMSIRMREKTRNDLLDLAEMEDMSITEYIDMLIRAEAKRKTHDLEQYRANKIL